MEDVPKTDNAEAEAPPPLDEEAERRIAWWLVGAVLVTLTAVKPLGGISVVGTVAFTLAALMQLYLPMRRADMLKRDLDFVGLHTQTWRADLKLVGILVAITFPPYIFLHHLYMTQAHEWVAALDIQALLPYMPRRVLSPQWPSTAIGWGTASWAFATMVATHALGVALPEETFYRGYLQPRLQSRWQPKWTLWGVRVGWAAIIASALFALGHFLGEWNPLRLGPFIPGLVFAWQRNATGSILGAITYHAACNVFGEILFSLYQPG